MKKSLIMNLLSMSETEIKEQIKSSVFNKIEFYKNIEDMKLNALLNSNQDLFEQLSVLKTTVTDILISSNSNNKKCYEGKLRKVMGKMFVSVAILCLLF